MEVYINILIEKRLKNDVKNESGMPISTITPTEIALEWLRLFSHKVYSLKD